jgi:hypothetical protein
MLHNNEIGEQWLSYVWSWPVSGVANDSDGNHASFPIANIMT